MGDGADLAIEQGMAEAEYRADNPYEFEEENNGVAPGSKFHYSIYSTCKYCNLGELHWAMNNSHWTLLDKNNKPHECLNRNNNVTCRLCHKKNLSWIKQDNRWILIDAHEKKRHVCGKITDEIFLERVNEHKKKHKTFDANRFLEWYEIKKKNHNWLMFQAWKPIQELNQNRQKEKSVKRLATSEI